MDEFNRNLRNIFIYALLGFIVIVVSSTLMVISLMYFIHGETYMLQVVRRLRSNNWDTILIRHFQYYWTYYITNHQELGFTAKKYFTIKLFIGTAWPWTFLMVMAIVFRHQLLEFVPYKKPESAFGDAHWATEKDIRKAGLRAKEGMIIGKDRRGFLVADGYQHTLLFAPTGSGKGVGFVIPNLLFWKDSLFVHDIKLENFDLTSGFRSQKLKQKVYLWNAASPEGISHAYNPLDFVSKKPGQMVDDVQKMAALLLPDMRDFWQAEARSLVTGIMLYLLVAPDRPATFGEVVRVLRSDDVVYNLAVVLDTMGSLISPVAYMNIAAFLQKADKERSGVISTANSKLELWSNPLIDAATARSDFNISDFKFQGSETSVYVGLTPDNIQRLEPLMQIFYQQATQLLTAHMPTKEEKVGVLFLMDEFPTLGKMEQFKSGIAYFRGYKVRLFLIIQDTEQLKGTYEDAGMNSFLSNSTYRITFSANNVETAELISKMLGNKSVESRSYNRPKFFDLNPSAQGMHISTAQRSLMLPQEVINLPRDKQIIMVEANHPMLTTKIFYYKEKFFTKRLLPAIPVPKLEPVDRTKKKEVSEDQEANQEQITEG